MSYSEYGWLLIQKRSWRCTSVLIRYGVDSHALAITLSSSGEATGRWPSLKRRVKKSFHDANPQYSSSGSCSNWSIPTARWASADFHPLDESLST